MYLIVHLFNAMHCGSIFRIEFSHTDRVRHNSTRFGSFSKFSIFRKFAFIFVSGFTAFTFVFVSKCRSRKQLRRFPTISVFRPFSSLFSSIFTLSDSSKKTTPQRHYYTRSLCKKGLIKTFGHEHVH